MSRWHLIALALVYTGCAHGVLIPKRADNGSGTYSDVAMPWLREDTLRYIPVSLLESRDFFAQAQACAVAYNTADTVGRSCSVTQGILRATQLTAAGLAVLAAGVSGRVENDVAKRHWEYTALGSTAALGALTGFDAWLNCSERTWVQKQLSAERLAKLNNAGRLATCGSQQAEYENELREAYAAVNKVKAHAANAGPGLEEALKVLQNPSTSPSDVRKVASQLGQPMEQKDGANAIANLPTINQDRELAGKALAELAPLHAVLCRDLEKTPDGQSRTPSSRDYMDAAHKELVECLTPRNTTFVNTAVGGSL